MSVNDRRWLADCLATLTASCTDGLDLDVVLVDNASTDGSASYAERHHPGVSVLSTVRREGFAAANNIVLRHALHRQADYVFLVNPDTRTPPDVVLRLVEFMEAWPEYGVIGPMQHVYTADGSWSERLNDWSSDALQAGEAHIFARDWPDHPSPGGPLVDRAPCTLEHAYVQGSALMCRTDALRRVGLLDETFHSYYEECDLCRRVRWAGWRVALCTDLGLQHHGGGGTGSSMYRRRKMLRNKYYFLMTDPEWSGVRTASLMLRWIRRDLARQGAAPAATTVSALGDTALGLIWLVSRVPRIIRQRRRHRALWRHGAGGPLREGRSPQ